MASPTKGWISLHRSIQDNWVFKDKPFNFAAAWIDLLMMANHESGNVFFNKALIHIERGQMITSVRRLSERWGWNNKKTLRFLKMLEDDQMLSRTVTKSATLLTLVNYDFYQGQGNTEGTPRGTAKGTEREHRGVQQGVTNNNSNNVNNENKGNKENKKNIVLDAKDKQKERIK